MCDIQKNVSMEDICVASRKKCHRKIIYTKKNVSNFKKMCHSWKMCDTKKSRIEKKLPQLEKRVPRRKMCHIQKHVSGLEKCVEHR